MKIYCNKFDANRPAPIKVSIPNYSEAKLGVEVYKNDEKVALLSNECSLVDGDTTISADGVRGGYITFPMTVGGDGESKDLTLSCYKGYEVDYDFEVSSTTRPMILWNYNIPQELKDKLVGKRIRVTDFDFGISSDIVSQVAFMGAPTQQSVFGDRVKGLQSYNKWHYSGRAEYFDSVLWDDISANNAIRVSFYGTTGRTGTINVKLHIGDVFYNNFKLGVNSVKSNIIEIDENTSTPSYTLPVASTSTLGGIKVGDNLSIAADGTLSAAAGGGSLQNVPRVFVQEITPYHTVPTLPEDIRVGDQFYFVDPSTGKYGYATSIIIGDRLCTGLGNALNYGTFVGKFRWEEYGTVQDYYCFIGDTSNNWGDPYSGTTPTLEMTKYCYQYE